jgi:hypothetical protein
VPYGARDARCHGRRRRRRWCYKLRPQPSPCRSAGPLIDRATPPPNPASTSAIKVGSLVMMVVLNLIRSPPPRHGTCLWLDYYHHGPPHTHLSSALVFTHAALPSPSAPSSLPAPSVSRLQVFPSTLTSTSPTLRCSRPPSPHLPHLAYVRLQPCPSYPYRAPPLTYMYDIHKASARVRVSTIPFALAVARASAFAVLSI